MTTKEAVQRAAQAQERDINADVCAKHGDALYCHCCYACAGEAIIAAVEIEREECALAALTEAQWWTQEAARVALNRDAQLSAAARSYALEAVAHKIRARSAFNTSANQSSPSTD